MRNNTITIRIIDKSDNKIYNVHIGSDGYFDFIERIKNVPTEERYDFVNNCHLVEDIEYSGYTTNTLIEESFFPIINK